MDKIEEIWNKVRAVPKFEKDAVCASCGSVDMWTLDAQKVCGECGLEQGQVFDYGMEWRYYGSSDSKHGSDPSRCGGVLDKHLSQLSLRTYIKGSGRELFRKYHKWGSGIYKETRFLEIFGLFNQIVEKNELEPKVGEVAKSMYAEVYSKKLIRGKNVDNLLLAIIYYAAKVSGLYVTYRDVLQMFEVAFEKTLTKANFSKGNKMFSRIYFATDPKNVYNLKPTTTAQYIERFHFVLERHANTEGVPFSPFLEEALQVAERAELFGLVTSHSSIAVAMGVIYFVSQRAGNESLTGNQIEEICGNITKNVIVKVNRDLCRWRAFL